MLKPEEKAIYLFNCALKKAISLDVAPTKENAKEIVLNELLAVKEYLYDATLLDDLNSGDLKKTFDHLHNVKTAIEKL